MIVNTQRLFVRLLPAMRIDTVCDVGSMDGADALRFRAVVPAANIYAFEAHPGNFGRMQANPLLRTGNIALVPLAAAERDGKAEFFMVDADYIDSDLWGGMSSLHKRSYNSQKLSSTRVRTTRLDTFLSDKLSPSSRMALWIDTEGKAHEVIEGAAGLLDKVHLLHLEVETTHCIAKDQKLYPQVKALLHASGFIELATDGPARQAQFNALFVHTDLPARMRRTVHRLLAVARLRYFLGRTLSGFGLVRIRRLRSR